MQDYLLELLPGNPSVRAVADVLLGENLRSSISSLVSLSGSRIPNSSGKTGKCIAICGVIGTWAGPGVNDSGSFLGAFRPSSSRPGGPGCILPHRHFSRRGSGEKADKKTLATFLSRAAKWGPTRDIFALIIPSTFGAVVQPHSFQLDRRGQKRACGNTMRLGTPLETNSHHSLCRLWPFIFPLQSQSCRPRTGVENCHYRLRARYRFPRFDLFREQNDPSGIRSVAQALLLYPQHPLGRG